MHCHAAQSATVGTYSYYSSQVKIAKLALQWLRIPSGKNQKVKIPPVLVRVPKDLRALDVKLRQPETGISKPLPIDNLCLIFLLVELGSPPRVIVALNTGRNEVSKAMVRLAAPSGVQFQVDETGVEGEGMSFDPDDTIFWLNIGIYPEEVSFEAIDGSIVLFDLKENSTIHLSVPHTDASAYHAMVHSISPSQYRFGG